MTAEPATAEVAPATGTVLPPIRPAFRALARAIVPETRELDAGGWGELEAIVEDALAQRPPAVRRQLAVFIRLLTYLPVFRWGRTFRSLDRDRQARFLHGMQSSRIFLFRRGFWGLRTLVYMGYYGREEAYRRIGYQARLRGWVEHPDAPDAARDATRRQVIRATSAGPAPGGGTGPGRRDDPGGDA
jgi:hypothetical protein